MIALTTYTATVEKARDYSVLKAIGATGLFLYRMVVWQSLIVGLAGSVLGIVASAVAASLIRPLGARVRHRPPLQRRGRGLRRRRSGCRSLAAFVPARRLNRIDPAMVFRA